MHQNYFWSWHLARSFWKLLCAALFLRSFVDGIIALCIWFPSLVKICSSAAFPLCPSTTSSLLLSSFLCCRIPRWFPANALHPLHKLHTLEHHFLPLQEWALVLLSAFYFCERIFDCHSMQFQPIWFYSVCLNFPAAILSIQIMKTVILLYHCCITILSWSLLVFFGLEFLSLN